MAHQFCQSVPSADETLDASGDCASEFGAFALQRMMNQTWHIVNCTEHSRHREKSSGTAKIWHQGKKTNSTVQGLARLHQKVQVEPQISWYPHDPIYSQPEDRSRFNLSEKLCLWRTGSKQQWRFMNHFKPIDSILTTPKRLQIKPYQTIYSTNVIGGRAAKPTWSTQSRDKRSKAGTCTTG